LPRRSTSTSKRSLAKAGACSDGGLIPSKPSRFQSALFALQFVQIPHFVEDFHAAIFGFGAVALVPPKAFGVRVTGVVCGSQSASFWLRLRRAALFEVNSVPSVFDVPGLPPPKISFQRCTIID